MRLPEYLELAKQNQGFVTDEELAKSLKIKRPVISQMRAEAFYPGDSVMIKIAELAGKNTLLALIQLAIWKAKDAAVVKRLKEIEQIVKKAAPVLFVVFALNLFLNPAIQRQYENIQPIAIAQSVASATIQTVKVALDTVEQTNMLNYRSINCAPFACSSKIELSHISKLEMSSLTSTVLRGFAGVNSNGITDYEQARTKPYRYVATCH